MNIRYPIYEGVYRILTNKEPNQAARYYNKIPLDSKDTASCLL